MEIWQLSYEIWSAHCPWMVYLQAENVLAWNGIFFETVIFVLKVYAWKYTCYQYHYSCDPYDSRSVYPNKISFSLNHKCLAVFVSLSIVQSFLILCRFQGNDSMKIKHKTCKTMWHCFIPGYTVYIRICQVQEYIYSLWYSINISGMISMIQELSTHIECNSKTKSRTSN
jgi:hypothetical protein